MRMALLSLAAVPLCLAAMSAENILLTNPRSLSCAKQKPRLLPIVAGEH
jgi:hypothetical protein